MLVDNVSYNYKAAVQDSLVNKAKRIISSTTFFMLAYLVANMIHQGLLGLLSIILGYTAQVSLHYVVIKPFENVYWDTFNVLFIFGLPPVLCVLLGYAVRFFLLNTSGGIYSWRLFFYWLQVCLYMIFIGQLFILPFGTSPQSSTGLYQTFSVVATWLSVPFPLLIVAMLVALVTAIIMGFFISNEVLRYSFSSKLIQTLTGKYSIVMQVYVLPLAIASPIIIACSNNLSFMVCLLFMPLYLLPLIGMFIRYKTDLASIRCSKADVLNTWPILAIAFTLLCWVIVLKFIE